MTGVGLVRPASAVAWELRAAWGRGLRVSLAIEGDVRRVEGLVEGVSPTGVSATVSGLLVPLGSVLAVFRPSRLGDSTYRDGDGAWAGKVPAAARRDPRQLTIPGMERGP